MTTTTQIPNSQKQLMNKPVNLDIGEKSGSFIISIPFESEYLMVLNDSIAKMSVVIGDAFQISSEAQVFTAGKYISMPLIQPTQKITVFWESSQPIAIGGDLVQFYFSNVTIPLSGGNYGEASTSQNVTVLNDVTTQFASPQHVDVDTLPALSAGANNIGKVDVNSLPTFPSGTNRIGIVQTESTTAGVMTQNSVAISATQSSNDINVSNYKELALDVNLTAFGGADNTYQLIVYRKGLDGIYYPIYTGSVVTNTVQQISVSLGHPNNQSLGQNIKVVETIGGTTPSVTRSMSIIGK